MQDMLPADSFILNITLPFKAVADLFQLQEHFPVLPDKFLML